MGAPEAQRRQEWVPVRPQVVMVVAETRQGARGPTPHMARPRTPAGPMLLVRRGPVFRAAVNPPPSTAG